MSPHTNRESHADGAPPGSGTGTVEAYEDNGRIVLFDAENPLAWVEATLSVRLSDQA